MILIIGILVVENIVIFGLADFDNSSCVVNDVVVQVIGECLLEEFCEIIVELIVGLELCDDNGILGDGDDDIFIFEVFVINVGVGIGWMVNDGIMGIYGDMIIFGFYSVVDIGDVLIFMIIDNDEVVCVDVFEVMVFNCINDCNLMVDVLNMVCNDEGMLNDLIDDIYIFDLIIYGMYVGDIWIVDDGIMGNFGDMISFGLYFIIDGNMIFDVVLDVNDNCVFIVLVIVLQFCFEVCDIEVVIFNVICDDNGILGDSSDDIFSFIVLVIGDDISNSWIVLDEIGMFIQFGMIGMFIVFNLGSLIVDGLVSIIFWDISNLDCEVMVEIIFFVLCFVVLCIIFVDVVIEFCDNNGNVDFVDDIFIFIIMVNGDDVDGSWMVDFDNLSGEYGIIYIFGLYFVGIDFDFIIFNVGNVLCSLNVLVDVLDECFEILDCDIIFVFVFNIECDDMGIVVFEDDIFVFQVLVVVLDENGILLMGAWVIDFVGSIFEGIYNVFFQVFEILVDVIFFEVVDLNVVDVLFEDCFISLLFILLIVFEIDCLDDIDFVVCIQDVQYIDG